MQLAIPETDSAVRSSVVHVNAHVQLRSEDDAVVVVLGGIPVAHFCSSDEAGRSHAMLMLEASGAAKRTELARAFGCARQTIYRQKRRFDEGGVAALVHAKRGPKSPRKLKGAVAKLLLKLAGQGVPKRQIATRLGVTEGAIRLALKRSGFKAKPAEQESLGVVPPTAETSVPAAAPQQEALPVSSLPAPEIAVEPTEAVATSAAQEGAPVDDAFALVVAAEKVLAASLEVAMPATAAGDADAEPKTVAAIHGGEAAWDRSTDRALAQLGLLDDASPQFGTCVGVRGAGVLLAIPALESTGLFELVPRLYRGIGPAFYGLRTVFVAMALLALLRVKRPERLRHRSPIDLGRVLGLDRAPEVKTLRRKIALLASQQQSEVLQRELARRKAASESEAFGCLYVDGHVRVYNGKNEIPKAWVTRMRISMSATVDHWVNDQKGEPVFVVTATPTSSTAHELPGVLAEIRKVVGERRVTVIFDRGGWSPRLFAQMNALGFDFVTYRKGHGVRKLPRTAFREETAVLDGREVKYLLADRPLRLRISKTEGLTIREIVQLSEDGKHQTSIVTSVKEAPAAEVAYRMFERWRQENFFKYMGEEFALDGLVQHGVEEADAERMVPNPKRKEKERELARIVREVEQLERRLGAAAADNEEARRPTMRGFKIANGELGTALRAKREAAERLRAEAHAIRARVTAKEAADGRPVVRLKVEAKRLTDVMKMLAYRAESSLVQLLRPHYSRVEDEGRKLVLSAIELAGDLAVVGGELRVTLEPAASPNRTKAIAALCAELNTTATVYPGTNLRLRYAIREG
ncbi:MAG: helix-turn-helix domain-containing protein [Polyangiaceae bacterium]|nr:helix-turn-helix domain-containing protein [Polyangiaceae bacterium]